MTPDLVARIAALGAGAFAIAVRDVIAPSAVLAFAGGPGRPRRWRLASAS